MSFAGRIHPGQPRPAQGIFLSSVVVAAYIPIWHTKNTETTHNEICFYGTTEARQSDYTEQQKERKSEWARERERDRDAKIKTHLNVVSAQRTLNSRENKMQYEKNMNKRTQPFFEE